MLSLVSWILFMPSYVSMGCTMSYFVFAVGFRLYFCLTFCGCWSWSQFNFKAFAMLLRVCPMHVPLRILWVLGAIFSFFSYQSLWYSALVQSHGCTAWVRLGIVPVYVLELGESLLHLLSLHGSPTVAYEGLFRVIQKDREWFGDAAAHPAACCSVAVCGTLRGGPTPGQSCQNKIKLNVI